MFKRILVPLDGSDAAERALQPALALSRQAGAEVMLMRAPVLAYIFVPGPSGPGLLYPNQSVDYSEKLSKEYLANLQARVSQAGLALRAEVRRGEAAEAIVESAAEEQADLIVMSSHGYSGVTRWLLGSVAEKVLRAAPCPVLVIRSPDPLRRVLVPLDGSALSEQALAPALEVATGLDLEVILIRAIPTIDRSQVDMLEGVEPGFGHRFEEEMREEAALYLRDLASSHHKPGLVMDTVVRFEPAADAILDCAESRTADLIAMATHGRTGLQRWVYGSVMEKVLRGAHHSMLVVRPASDPAN